MLKEVKKLQNSNFDLHFWVMNITTFKIQSALLDIIQHEVVAYVVNIVPSTSSTF